MSETRTVRAHLEWTKATLRLAEGANDINSHLLDAVVALDTRIIPALSSVSVPPDSQLLLNLFAVITRVFSLAASKGAPSLHSFVASFASKLASSSFSSVALKLKRDFIRSAQKSHQPDHYLVCVYDSYLRSSMIALRVFHGESSADLTTPSAPHEYFFAKMNDTNVLDYLELPPSEDLYVLEEHRLGIAYVFLMDSAKDAGMRSFDPKVALEKISILIKSCSLFLNNHSYMMHLLALHISLSEAMNITVQFGSFLVQSRILHAIQGYVMHLESNSCRYESSEWKHDEAILSWLWDRAFTSLSWSSPAVRMTRAWMVVGLQANPSKLIHAVSKMLITPHGAAMLIRVLQESLEQAESPSFQRQNLSHSLTLSLQAISSWESIPDSSIVLLMDFLLRGAIKNCLLESVNIQMLHDWVHLLEILHKIRPQLRVQIGMQENVGLLVNLSMRILDEGQVRDSDDSNDENAVQVLPKIFDILVLSADIVESRLAVLTQLAHIPMFLEILHNWVTSELAGNMQGVFEAANLVALVLRERADETSRDGLKHMLNLEPVCANLARILWTSDQDSQCSARIIGFCGVVECWLGFDTMMLGNSSGTSCVNLVIQDVWCILRRLLATRYIHERDAPIRVAVLGTLEKFANCLIRLKPQSGHTVLSQRFNQSLIELALSQKQISCDETIAIFKLLDMLSLARSRWFATVIRNKMKYLQDLVLRLKEADAPECGTCSCIFDKIVSACGLSQSLQSTESTISINTSENPSIHIATEFDPSPST